MLFPVITSVTSIHFGWYFEGGISKGMFGDNITSLSFSGPFFNEELSCVWLPKYLKLLKLDIGFQKDIKKGQLSNTLVHYYSIQIIKEDSLPLDFGMFPNSLISLTFHCFNKPIEIGIFPSSIESLNLGWNFNQIIKPGILPKNLKNLDIYNSSFKQDLSIDGILPQSFKNLTISIDNLSLFQSFDSKFSSKYVKLFKTNN
ncbi:hypothetical protein ACTFIW_003422 [Dictyostelium discoideum]